MTGVLPESRAAALRRAGPLALAGLAANGASVVLTVVIARLLDSREYGDLNQLISLFLVLSMPGSALLVAVVRRVTAWESRGEAHLADAWGRRIRRVAAAGLGAFAVGALLLRGQLADLLELRSAEGVAEILTAGGGWALLSVDRGLLQARRDYGTLATNLGVEATARVAITIALVAADLGVQGAALGLLGSMVLAVLHARWALERLPSLGAAAPPGDADIGAPPVVPATPLGRRHLAADAAVALAALALLAALQGLDVVVLGREAPGNKGDYAAISVSCKALVFVAIVLSGYLLPEAAARSHRGEHALRPLAAALGLVAVPAAVLVGVSTVAPTTFLRVFFGDDLVDAAGAFAELALAMTCLAATVLFAHYLLGMGRRRVVPILGAAAVVGVVVLSAADGNYVDTARVDLALHATLALVTGAMVLLVPRARTPRALT